MRKKKIKKILAGILSTTMILSTMVVTGSADTTGTDTIKTDNDVTLTISRYDNNGTASVAVGTGAQVTPASDWVPLEGVEYQIYKIADIDTTVTTEIVYNVVDSLKTELGTTIDSTKSGTEVYTDDVKAIIDADTFTKKSAKSKTNANGQITFSKYADGTTKLEQGLYLVVETNAVNTSKISPFLVSLPTTVKDGDADWIYDVYAYPKVTTGAGQITIKKYVVTAGETATDPKTYIADTTFFIQKKLTTGKWQTVIKDRSKNNIAVDDTSTTDVNEAEIGLLKITNASAGVTVNDLPTGIYRVIENKSSENYITDSSVAFEFEITKEGYTKIGTKTYDPNETVTTAATYGTPVIEVKNEEPTISKKVLEKNTTDSWAKLANYSTLADDTIKFKAEVTVPSIIEKLSTFTIVDTYDSTQFNTAGNFAITYYAGATALSATAAAAAGLPTVTADVTSNTAGRWEIDYKSVVDKLADNNITKIEVVFDTSLKSTATIAGEGNLNTATIEFTNHVYPNGDPDSGEPGDPSDDPENPVKPPEPDDPSDPKVKEETTKVSDQAAVYTFDLKINKSFKIGNDTQAIKDASDNILLKAKFVLYRVAKTSDIPTDGTALNAKIADGTLKAYTTEGDAPNYLVKIGEYETDKNGEIVISQSGTYQLGISNGTYYLEEVDTADGYNLLSDLVKVDVNITVTQTIFEKTYKKITYYADNTSAEETFTVAGKTVTKTLPANATKYGDSKVEYSAVQPAKNIVNKKGFSFPVTGGKGTILFTLIGLVLMMGGVSIYFTARKRKTN